MIKLFVAISAIILNCLHIILPEDFQFFARCYVSGALGLLMAKCIEDYQWNNFIRDRIRQFEEKEKNEPNNI